MITLKNVLVFIAISLVASIITACGNREKPELTQAQIDSNLIYICKESMKKRMKDPESAEFRDVFVYRASGGTTVVVCGEVNSRNSFGGYAGFQRFISAGEGASFLATDMKAGEMDTVWKQLCGN